MSDYDNKLICDADEYQTPSYEDLAHLLDEQETINDNQFTAIETLEAELKGKIIDLAHSHSRENELRTTVLYQAHQIKELTAALEAMRIPLQDVQSAIINLDVQIDRTKSMYGVAA